MASTSRFSNIFETDRKSFLFYLNFVNQTCIKQQSVCGWIFYISIGIFTSYTWFEIDSKDGKLLFVLRLFAVHISNRLKWYWLTQNVRNENKRKLKITVESLYFKQNSHFLGNSMIYTFWSNSRTEWAKCNSRSTRNGTFFNMSTVFLLKYYAPCTMLCKQRDIL